MVASPLLWSVIIPTLNRADSLGRTLRAMAAQTLHPLMYEILVVDNGSTDHTADVVTQCIKDFPARPIRFMEASPPGLLSGRHKGAQESRGAVLTFVDDDIDVAPNYGASILAAFRDAKVCLVGGPCRAHFEADPPGWLEKYCQRQPGRFVCGSLSLYDFGDRPHTMPAEQVWGLNFSIRRDTLWECGGFHPDTVPQQNQMYQGDGETGLCLVMRTRGYKAQYEPGAAVTHIIPASRLTETYFHHRFFFQGVCDSYTEIRAKGHTRDLHIPAPVRVETDSPDALHQRIRNAYVDGYLFHQNAVKQSPRLLEWVTKPEYWDYAYPELEPQLRFRRQWAEELLENPLKVLQNRGQVQRLCLAYAAAAQYADAMRVVSQLIRTCSGSSENAGNSEEALLKITQAEILALAGRKDEAIALAAGVLAENSACQPAREVLQQWLSSHEGTDAVMSPVIEERMRRLENMMTEQKTYMRHYAASAHQQRQLALMLQYRSMARTQPPQELPSFADVGFRVHSQFEEDGILLYIFALIGFTNRKVVEMCAGNGEAGNTANLILHHGCHGLLFEGNKTSIEHAQRFFSSHADTCLFPPLCRHAWLTRDNVNELMRREGFTGSIDFFSLDVDGNDYWFWGAIDVISPRVFICETHNVCPDDAAITIPYKEDFYYTDPANYHKEFRSASPLAMINLSRKKGYRLVGSHKYGFNLVFLRNDVGLEHFPEVPLSSISCNPYTQEAQRTRWPLVKDAPWVLV